MTVESVKASASDADVIWAAKVSTSGDRSREEIHADPAKICWYFINYLVRERHGSPFEHNSITFFISLIFFPRIHETQNKLFQRRMFSGFTLIYFENEKKITDIGNALTNTGTTGTMEFLTLWGGEENFRLYIAQKFVLTMKKQWKKDFQK